MEKIKTKDRILSAALDLFSEKGYDQTSIDLIAETVGIKGPSIYAHYKGKEDILDSLIIMMEQKYDEKFGSISGLDKIPESMDEFREDCLERVGFTMKDPQIQKVRRFCTKEQYRSEKIAALTSKHQLTGNQEMYALMLEKMMEKKLIRRFDAGQLALELVAPVTLMIEIADREPERTDEMWTQINMHLSHFIKVYGIQ
ncbi:MAG: TetR/AcrR family transcriptional regulator [Lachnospiraceae bacterium]|nr:TetR/AcrR family transcriptional regulator [Lachnospiraceae bacterium]MDY4971506.1 TetR/AcrR family transcriptional regulator [Lachnospiraceae bacterium]